MISSSANKKKNIRKESVIKICRIFGIAEMTEKRKPCTPSPCGANSICREFNEQASCSCLPGFLGQPPSCRPECSTSAECEQTRACLNNKCINPCLNACAPNADCTVRNHNPICSCPPKHSGDPFLDCFPISKYTKDLYLQIFALYRLTYESAKTKELRKPIMQSNA